LSFAAGQRSFARAVHGALCSRGIRVFFDEVRQAELWGEDLAEHFDKVFRKDARFCVACVSEEWVERVWPAHERRSAVARTIQEPGYFLPIRFDETEIPGLSPSIGYLEASEVEPEQVAVLIAKKLAGQQRSNYLPPEPNRIIAALEVAPGDEERISKSLTQANNFLGCLEELADEERRLVISVIRFGCPCPLPKGIHLLLDRYERLTGWNLERTRDSLARLQKVPGFTGTIEPGDDPSNPRIDLEWEPMSVGSPKGPAMDVANAMIREAGCGACDHCYEAALERLDFSRCSTNLDWNSEERAAFDLGDCPPPLRDLAAPLLDADWTMELAPEQIRFLAPGEQIFHTAPLFDQHDPESIALAREILEDIVQHASLGKVEAASTSTGEPS
jgi:hypothetical protein